MASWSSSRIVAVLGWVLAAAVIVFYIASRYEFRIERRSPESRVEDVGKERQAQPKPAEQPSVPYISEKQTQSPTPAQVTPPSEPTSGLEIGQITSSEPVAQQQPTEPSTEELFRLASPAVVLIQVFDAAGKKRSQGSGFVVATDGSVVTNYHVIRGAFSALARTQDGSSWPVGGVVGYDSDRDVAVIKIEGSNMRALRVSDSEQLRVGQKLVAIGSPFGLQNTVSEGIISGLRGGLIQMTTPISPGSSGGAVLNSRGEVVAVAVATVRGGQNINFAVPIEWAKPYVGGPVHNTLAQITSRNTVTQYVVHETISVPAHDSRMWTITVNPNKMANAELHIAFQSTGGAGGNIRVYLARGQQFLYDSGRVPSDEKHVPLQSEGEYVLVIDNKGSIMFSRTVTANISLSYVK